MYRGLLVRIMHENTLLLCHVSVLNDLQKVLILNCLFLGTGETEDKTSSDQTSKVCSEATTAKRRGKYLYQTTSRKYAQHKVKLGCS